MEKEAIKYRSRRRDVANKLALVLQRAVGSHNRRAEADEGNRQCFRRVARAEADVSLSGASFRQPRGINITVFERHNLEKIGEALGEEYR